MKLDTAAVLAGEFLKGGTEPRGPEFHAGQLFIIHPLREPGGIEPGCAADFKRASCSPAFAEIGAFEQALPRIHGGRIHGRHVGRWHDPRESSVLKILDATPTPASDHAQFAGVEVQLALIKHREFTDGESMPGGEIMSPDKALEAWSECRSLDDISAQRVGAVQHHDEQTPGESRLQAVTHRGLEGVIAAPDVLEIDNQRIEATELVSRRFQALRSFPLETVKGHRLRRFSGGSTGDGDEVLRLAKQTVFRTEDRRQF